MIIASVVLYDITSFKGVNTYKFLVTALEESPFSLNRPVALITGMLALDRSPLWATWFGHLKFCKLTLGPLDQIPDLSEFH